nr:MAG TPA: hypothetical protein [Bacteriophage sp.]
MGDYDQISTRFTYKVPSEAEIVTVNTTIDGAPVSIRKDRMNEICNNHFFIRSPKLGVSMRSDNLLITENNYQLIKYVQEESGQIKLKYYEDETGLYGHKIIGTNIEEVKNNVRKLISTLKQGEKIGFIYSSANLQVFNVLTNDPSIKDYIEPLSNGSA